MAEGLRQEGEQREGGENSNRVGSWRNRGKIRNN